MSKIILGWQLPDKLNSDKISDIITDVKNRYQYLFAEKLMHHGLWNQNQGLLHFDANVADNSLLKHNGHKIVCASGQPNITNNRLNFSPSYLDAHSLEKLFFNETGEADPESLDQINPPFTFCSFDKNKKALSVIHDGLGLDQFFILELKNGIIFSNKCWPILQLYEKPPSIDYYAWKLYFTLGWFPENFTPFKEIRTLKHGEIISCDGFNIRSHTEDVFHSWFAGKRKNACNLNQGLEAAKSSFDQIIIMNHDGQKNLDMGLTGGMDSRAICSAIIKNKIPCEFLTRGTPDDYDVIIAKRIASQYKLKHTCENEVSNYPSIDTLKSQFEKLVLWSECLVEPVRVSGIPLEPHKSKFGYYISGAGGEISRGYYYTSPYLTHTKFLVHEHLYSRLIILNEFSKVERYKNTIIDSKQFKIVDYLYNQISKGKQYGIANLSLLDFYYLNERMRRWFSAHLAANLFDNAIIPFINIDHFQLAFSLNLQQKSERLFLKFIMEKNEATLLKFPVNEALYQTSYFRIIRIIRKLTKKDSFKTYKHYEWEKIFKHSGKNAIATILHTNSPLWDILEKKKAQLKFNAYLAGKDHDNLFLLRLLAFDTWFKTFFNSK